MTVVPATIYSPRHPSPHQQQLLQTSGPRWRRPLSPWSLAEEPSALPSPSSRPAESRDLLPCPAAPAVSLQFQTMEENLITSSKKTKKKKKRPMWPTQPALYNLDGAVEMLDGLAVLLRQAVGYPHLVVGLSQLAAVRLQVLCLQLQTHLKVLQCLCVVPWGWAWIDKVALNDLKGFAVSQKKKKTSCWVA